MSLSLKSFAKEPSGVENSFHVNGGEDSDDSDIAEYEPPKAEGEYVQVAPRHMETKGLPELENDKYMFGPTGSNGTVSVIRRSGIEGYDMDTAEAAQMEQIGLPTGFTYGSAREKSKKGEKKTFYCSICLIELNSEDTMQSHMKGVKHMKKNALVQQQASERGETSTEAIMPIPNPQPTKKKVPIKLQLKIRETRDPVVGLKHVREYITESDPEMDPHYECNLCGSKGIANGMFSHIMGHTHRKNVMKYKYPDNPRYHDNTQKECLEWAARHAENDEKLSSLIEQIQSDEEYPWPPGKAPWSKEKGGTGLAPPRAKENYGRNQVKCELKESLPSDSKPGIYTAGGLPVPESIESPKSPEQAARMVVLAQALLLKAAGDSSASTQLRVKMLTSSLLEEIRKQNNLPAAYSRLNRMKKEGEESSRGSSSTRSSSGGRKRKMERNSRSPSPPPHRPRQRESSPRGGYCPPPSTSSDRLCPDSRRSSSRDYPAARRDFSSASRESRDSPSGSREYSRGYSKPGSRDFRDRSPERKRHYN